MLKQLSHSFHDLFYAYTLRILEILVAKLGNFIDKLYDIRIKWLAKRVKRLFYGT